MKERRRRKSLCEVRAVPKLMIPKKPETLGCPYLISSPDLSFLHEAASDEEARTRVKYEGTEADDDSKIISIGGPFSNVVTCESESVTFEEVLWRPGFIPESETALDSTGVPIR